MSREFLPGYALRLGSGADRALLVKFLGHTYRELEPDRHFSDVAQMVEQYFSPETPVWFVEVCDDTTDGSFSEPDGYRPLTPGCEKVACLWLGNSVDRISGERYTHILLVYVVPKHRRRGIGSRLVQHAENQAKQRGDRQIGLQVFANNQPALTLYQSCGYEPLSFWMTKSL